MNIGVLLGARARGRTPGAQFRFIRTYGPAPAWESPWVVELFPQVMVTLASLHFALFQSYLSF